MVGVDLVDDEEEEEDHKSDGSPHAMRSSHDYEPFGAVRLLAVTRVIQATAAYRDEAARHRNEISTGRYLITRDSYSYLTYAANAAIKTGGRTYSRGYICYIYNKL